MEEHKQGFGGMVRESARFVFLTLLIVIPFRLFIAQPFIVSGDSMVPTFNNGEYLIVDELSYHLREPKRGEVVIFRYPKDTSKFFIKRVIGLPGETVNVSEGVVTVAQAGSAAHTLTEPYIASPSPYEAKLTLGASEYFVMGDNRPESSDSRVWGAVTRDYLIGRALVRLLPLARAEVLPGSYAP